MTFRLHHSVVLDCPLEIAWTLLSSPYDLPRLQQALPSCKDCIITLLPTESADGDTPAIHDVSQKLDASTRPTDLPWPDIDNSPHAVHFTFKLGLASVVGAQTAVQNEHAVLFHSRVAAAGIEEYKLRIVESAGDGKSKVTETVWGKAPAPLAWMLRLTGTAAKTHMQHMESYASLLP